MDRVYQSGAAVSPPSAPASPSSGYPTAGNPQTAVQATKPGPYWYHMVTESLLNVITEAGLTPDHADLTLLRQAIYLLVDSRISDRDFKQSCRAATTANITLSGLQTIDGVTLVAGDRVLVKSQSTGSQNGIYVAASGAWSRATDADSGAELSAGALIPVTEGTLNGDILWILSTNDPIVIGTTALVFASVGNLTDVGTPGTYNSVTTDSKGRVISGSSLAYGRTDQNNTWAKAQRGAITALTDAATIAVDLSLSNNFSVTLGGNRTLANPTNAVAGQSGVIVVTQDGAGGRTLAYDTNYKAAGGIANLAALSTGIGDIDHLYYYVETPTRIVLSIAKDVS